MSGFGQLEPELRTRENRGAVVTNSRAGKSVAVEDQTPVRVLARLTPNPGPAPVGFTVMTGEDTTLALINRGDYLGIDGRWCPVVTCTSVNGWISVDTPYGYPSVAAAFMDVRVHLARLIDVEGVAA